MASDMASNMVAEDINSSSDELSNLLDPDMVTVVVPHVSNMASNMASNTHDKPARDMQSQFSSESSSSHGAECVEDEKKIYIAKKNASSDEHDSGKFNGESKSVSEVERGRVTVM